MNGSTFKRCGCRDGAGALVGPSCPALAKSSHGTWHFRAELAPGPGGQAQAAELKILGAAGAGAGLVLTREDGAPLSSITIKADTYTSVLPEVA